MPSYLSDRVDYHYTDARSGKTAYGEVMRIDSRPGEDMFELSGSARVPTLSHSPHSSEIAKPRDFPQARCFC
ncbi:unnamed protein product [Protopolystoma xenopodis]|uniref:Uncharacterized protein n=1 Tax=Protopolystoma xenopodis TaxID=117903 RepID=A0A3S5BZJ4_9PLAT|nr:unnamed protein product [Protopolystoma xenopodis]